MRGGCSARSCGGAPTATSLPAAPTSAQGRSQSYRETRRNSWRGVSRADCREDASPHRAARLEEVGANGARLDAQQLRGLAGRMTLQVDEVEDGSLARRQIRERLVHERVQPLAIHARPGIGAIDVVT